MMIVEQLLDWVIDRETELLGELPAPVSFCPSQMLHMTWTGLEAGPPRWKPAISRLKYRPAVSLLSGLQCFEWKYRLLLQGWSGPCDINSSFAWDAGNPLWEPLPRRPLDRVWARQGLLHVFALPPWVQRQWSLPPLPLTCLLLPSPLKKRRCNSESVGRDGKMLSGAGFHSRRNN